MELLLKSSGGGVNDEESDSNLEFLAQIRFCGGKSDSLSDSSEGFGVIKPFGSSSLRFSNLTSSIFYSEFIKKNYYSIKNIKIYILLIKYAGLQLKSIFRE